MNQAHYKGNFSIRIEHNVLFAVVSGAWSASTAKRYVKQFKQKVEEADCHEWAQIVFLENWILGTPDIEPIIAELSAWFMDKNLKATAFINKDAPHKEFQLENMLIEKPQGYQRQYFQKEADAIAWLAQLGFDITDVD